MDIHADLSIARGAAGQEDVAGDEAPTQRRRCGQCQSGPAIFPFSMAFQPVVDIAAWRIDSFEALVRGAGGEGAGHVLSQVDQQNVYAFDNACRVRAIEIAARLGLKIGLNINFLPNAVYEPRACIRATLDAAARTGFDPRLLTFEIVETESVDSSHLGRIIDAYQKLGFRVALDDFASGFSGLSRLAELRPDTIKLDRALIQGCDQDRRRLAIVSSMLRLSDELGTKVVLEGVETEGEFLALRDIGARFMQGFFLCRPQFERLAAHEEVFGRLEKKRRKEGVLF